METKIDEVWKDVAGYNGFYLVSNLGRVKSLITNRILKPQINQKRYVCVRLYNKEGYKHYNIHRVVASAFIPNPHNKPQVNHINGLRQDNRVVNLEWVTGQENVRHSMEVFGTYFGEKHSKAKITEAQVIEMRKMHADGVPVKTIACHFNINWNTLRTILYGYKWKRTKIFSPHIKIKT